MDGDIVERHKKQERRMETIVRESKPVQLEGVVKCAPDAGKWDGLDKLDVASKFNMFEKAAEERESDKRHASDRWDLGCQIGPIISFQQPNYLFSTSKQKFSKVENFQIEREMC